MFSPPKLTVVRCKKEERHTLRDELNAKLREVYNERYLDEPKEFEVEEESIICYPNRIDSSVVSKRLDHFQFILELESFLVIPAI